MESDGDAAAGPQAGPRQHTQFLRPKSARRLQHGRQPNNINRLQQHQQCDERGFAGRERVHRGDGRPARAACKLRCVCDGIARCTAMAIILGMVFLMASLERASVAGDDDISTAHAHGRVDDATIRWIGSWPAQAFEELYSSKDAFDPPKPLRLELRGGNGSGVQQQQRSVLGAAAAAQYGGAQQQQRSALGAAAAARYHLGSSSSAWLATWQRSRPGWPSQHSARLVDACTERAAWSVRRLHRMRGRQFACNQRRRRE